MNNQFLQTLLPGFTAGLQHLHDTLIGPAALICVAGIYLRLLKASASYNEIYGVLVRLGLALLVIGQVYTLGDIFTQLADDLVKKTGWNPDQNMWQDYMTSIATKYNPVTQPGNNNPLQFMFNAFQGAWIAAWATFVYGVSIFAAGLMLIMRLVQAILINLEMGLSPLFLAAIMVPSLVGLATKWGTAFIALCLWTVAYAISDLGTKAMMDIAVNSGNNPVVGAVNIVGGSTVVWFFCAVWVIFMSVMGPVFIWKSVVTNGSHGLHMIPSAMMGAAFAGTALARGATGSVSSGVSAAQALSSPPPQQSSNVNRPTSLVRP